MGAFTEQMRSRLPQGMDLPEPFAALFDWIEGRDLLHPSQGFAGDRYGSLQPLELPYDGTMLLLRVKTPAQAAESGCWLNGGGDGAATARRLVPFARTGGDGFHAAFWVDDAGV